MSNKDILTIDTGAGIITPEQKRLMPLPLFDEHHPMLKQSIPEFKGILPNDALTVLINRLKMTMRMYGGIGLSANQCGVFERVFVIGTDQFQIACINPKIISHSKEIDRSPEGCLSYPGLYLHIPRYKSIEVEFYNEKGDLKQMKLEGLSARCFQHELDHMNGVRFEDHVGPASMMLARQKQQKRIKKILRRKK
jgi:peptide deformylase